MPGDSRLAGPVLIDDEFLGLVEQKIRARSTLAMQASITKSKVRHHFDSLWETEIKRRFSENLEEFVVSIPFEFATPAERRARFGVAAPTIKFTR